MTLAHLLDELRRLLVSPQLNLPAIVQLLEAHRSLAEYEVARCYAVSAVLPYVEASARSVDPRERRSALKAVSAVLPRSAAANVVRHLVKDPDAGVRRAAMTVCSRLSLWNETALPDTAAPPPRFLGPRRHGGWNATGWAFGLERVRRKLPKGARRVPPVCRTEPELLALLGITAEEELTRLLRPGTGTGAAYVAFDVPKKSGGLRTLHAPRAALKRVQRAILEKVLGPVPVHPACHGFVTGRSTVSNASPHVGAQVLYKSDLRDFFPTVHYRRVRGLFEELGYPIEVATVLARLTTFRPEIDGRVVWPGFLPQGAPTSPAIANLICRRLDQRLAGLAARVGATYTRYADDLTFSFAAAPTIALGRMMWWVDQICAQEGFAEHSGKRRILRRGSQQRVTGLVVNESLSVPRALRRRFRAILHNCRTHGLASQAHGRADFGAYLRGFAAYVTMVQPELGRKLTDEITRLLEEEASP